MARWWTLIPGLSAACSVPRMLPRGPAVSAQERSAMPMSPSGAEYTGEPLAPFPVLPLLVWGAAYDLDLVIVSRHPEWDMHEYARLATPDGPLWLAKDARSSTMAQSIVADIDDLRSWWPELPVARRAYPLIVEDRSTGELVDVSLSYENIDGQSVEITYRGKPPHSLQRLRNGSTMGHSVDQVMAVLDLSHRDFGESATVRIDGEDIPLERIAGLIPFRMALKQTQAGLAIGSFREEAIEGGLRTHHRVDEGEPVAQDWTLTEEAGHLLVQQHSPLRTLRYRFRLEDGARELTELTVTQWGRTDPPAHVVLSPALPDLSRRFEGTHTSRFVVDVNGQRGHARGRLEASWGEDGPQLLLIPEAPWWVTDRPMRTTVRYKGDGSVQIDIVRIEALPPSP